MYEDFQEDLVDTLLAERLVLAIDSCIKCNY